MDVRNIVQTATTAAIATDAENKTLAWNQAAEELFGYAAAQIIGRDFRQVFQPRDCFGNPLGYDSSLFFSLLKSGDSIRNFECSLRKACGEYQHSSVSVVMVLGPCPSTYHLVHLLWPIQRRRRADELIARLLNGSEFPSVEGLGAGLRSAISNASILTQRQKEILRRVAEGQTTDQIANGLSISPDTVRNHIRHLFSRLGVSNRAEAVSVAHRRHLI